MVFLAVVSQRDLFKGDAAFLVNVRSPYLDRFHPSLHNRTFEKKSHVMLAAHYYDIGLFDVID